jgi:hypothetical protein
VCLRVLGSLGVDETADEEDGALAVLGASTAPAEPLAPDAIEERAARVLIARFAVGEPLAASCFSSARARAREPIIAWAYTELLRDVARHGSFGAQAGAWVIRDWAAPRRQALWTDCLREMESFERRNGGPVIATARTPFRRDTAADALGLLSPEASCSAVIASIPRWVLPHLAPLGVVPPAAEAPTLLQ